MTVVRLIRSVLSLWFLAGPVRAQTLEILSPENDGYVSGRATVEAALDPGGNKVKRLLFFVDGKLVCEMEAGPYQCPFDAGYEIESHLIRVVAEFYDGPRLVENLATPARVRAFRFHSEVIAVLVPVAVTRKGKIVTGLGVESFRVYEDGEPQEIVSFATQEAPLEVVIAVDASGSMRRSMDEMKQAVRAFMSMLTPQDRVTLLVFNDEIYTLADRDTDAERRLSALDRIDPFGKTSLYDAIARAFSILGTRSGKRAVVVFTDGEDISSQLSLEELETLVESGNATLYMIGTKEAISDAKLRKVLERLSERSGGRALLDEKLERLVGAFTDVHREVQGQYLLGYSPTNKNFDGAWRSLRIEVLANDYEVRGREGYRAYAHTVGAGKRDVATPRSRRNGRRAKGRY